MGATARAQEVVKAQATLKTQAAVKAQEEVKAQAAAKAHATARAQEKAQATVANLTGALREKYLEATRAAIERKENVNFDVSPFIWAAAISNSPDILKLLLSHPEIDLNRRNLAGDGVLHMRTISNKAISQLLKQKDID